MVFCAVMIARDTTRTRGHPIDVAVNGRIERQNRHAEERTDL